MKIINSRAIKAALRRLYCPTKKKQRSGWVPERKNLITLCYLAVNIGPMTTGGYMLSLGRIRTV